MWTKQRRQNSLIRDVAYFVSIVLIAYFAYHSYCGAFGLQIYAKQEEYRQALQAQLDKLVHERLFLEKRAHLLRDASVEKDTLDEYARRTLNLANKEEYVILLNHGDLGS